VTNSRTKRNALMLSRPLLLSHWPFSEDRIAHESLAHACRPASRANAPPAHDFHGLNLAGRHAQIDLSRVLRIASSAHAAGGFGNR
jgi:hypothetical protein